MTNKRKNGRCGKMKMPALMRIVIFFLTILPIQAHALAPGQVFNKVKNAVVVVKTFDNNGKQKSPGSGVLVSSGKIATNCYVVAGGATYEVGRGKQVVAATLYAEDRDKDICILDAKGLKGKTVQLGKAANLKVGDPVYAVGAPKNLALSLSGGIVSQLRGGLPPLIRTTAAISPGSSGGGLFDGKGRLVGLTTLYIEGGQSLYFAMPVEWIGEVKPGSKPVVKGHGQTEWLKRAIVLEQMNDWQGMLDWCQKWTESDPESGDAWVSIGIAYNGLKRYDNVIEAYHQALRINPENAEAWNNLGSTYHYLDRYDDAISAYLQAVRINPEYTSAWFNLGVAYRKLKRYDDAISAYRQAIRINPEYTSAWYNLGVAYFLSGNRSAALDAVRELQRLDPKKADVLLTLFVPR